MSKDKPLSILHFVPTTLLSVGGTVRAALDICSVMASRGHNVTWLTADATDAPPEWVSGEPLCPKVATIDPLLNGPRLSATSKQTCKQYIQEADVAHLHGLWSPCNAQFASIAKHAKTPWVISVHGVLDDWSMSQRSLKKRIYLATVIRSMVRSASTILTTAKEEFRQASKWIPHDRVSIVPYIMDFKPYKTIPSPTAAIEKYGPGTFPTVLFLSRIHEKKSIETIIDAAVILKDSGTPIRLFIAGTGDTHYQSALEKRVKDKGVGELVIFLGLVVGELKLSLYAMADIFALPTQQENFGLVYPEAMLCGTPVITTKGTDIWRELQEAGATIVNRTPESFADGIANILSNQEALATVGLQGREYVQQWLDPDIIAAVYEDLYANASIH